MSVGLQTLAGHRGPVGCSISPAGSCSWGCPGRSRGGRAQDRGKGSLHAEIHARGWSYPNTTGTEAIPVLSSLGHHPRGVGRAGIGIHPSSQCHGAALCVPFPVWSRTGGFKLSPLGLPPRSLLLSWGLWQSCASFRLFICFHFLCTPLGHCSDIK